MQPPSFHIDLDTNVLVRAGSSLSKIRMSFQKQLLSENKFEDRIAILKAPTGIGKTKIFLDLVNKISCTHPFERVFYFSPLLALTDDFEGKLFPKNMEKNLLKDQDILSVLEPADAKKVLVYNHAFRGSLHKKQSRDSGIWLDAENEDPEFFKSPRIF